MNDFKEELLGGDESRFTSIKSTIKSRYIIAALITLILGWFLGTLFFGNNTIIRLNELKFQLETLKKETQTIKHENARLQKELFELQQIRGEN